METMGGDQIKYKTSSGEVVTFNGIGQAYEYFSQHPDEYSRFYQDLPTEMKTYFDDYFAYQQAYAEGDYNKVYDIAGRDSLINLTPEEEKYLDNQIARENTQNAQQFEEHMRDTDTLSQGEQLRKLGLSTSGVLDIGGASHSGVAAADNMRGNISQNRQMYQYQQKMGLAKAAIGMVGQMASSGIYGSAIGHAKSAAATLASATAHSAFGALKSTDRKLSGSMADLIPDNGGSYPTNNSPIG